MTASLVSQLEKAGEGSRELDCDLAEAFGEVPENAFRMHGVMAGRYGTGPYSAWTAPAYSTSLDAALALAERVLPGWDWSVCRLEPNHGFAKNGLFYATVERLPDDWSPIFDASAKTPAIALCLAILRATSQEQPNV